MNTLDNKSLEQYLAEYARVHTNGDIEEAKTHEIVKNVIALYKERQKSHVEEPKGRPVKMHKGCDA